MDVLRISSGQLHEHWNVVDMHGLLAQLAAPPSDPAAVPARPAGERAPA